MNKYVRTETPICVGESYPSGSDYVSWYEVLKIEDGSALLRRPKDGWTVTARNPALYETPYGVRLIWDFSVGGYFADGYLPEKNTEAKERFIKALRRGIEQYGIPSEIVIDTGTNYELSNYSRK